MGWNSLECGLRSRGLRVGSRGGWVCYKFGVGGFGLKASFGLAGWFLVGGFYDFEFDDVGGPANFRFEFGVLGFGLGNAGRCGLRVLGLELGGVGGSGLRV